MVYLGYRTRNILNVRLISTRPMFVSSYTRQHILYFTKACQTCLASVVNTRLTRSRRHSLATARAWTPMLYAWEYCRVLCLRMRRKSMDVLAYFCLVIHTSMATHSTASQRQAVWLTGASGRYLTPSHRLQRQRSIFPFFFFFFVLAAQAVTAHLGGNKDQSKEGIFVIGQSV